jgi:hypothetical protein
MSTINFKEIVEFPCFEKSALHSSTASGVAIFELKSEIKKMNYFQLFWTPDIIIHDLVSFNKPEILNQVC